MLRNLRLVNVGPAPTLDIEFSARINLVAGDNGLGKSFLLDLAWWSLTRTLSSSPARPIPGRKNSSIGFSFDSKTKKVDYTSKYDAGSQSWIGKPGRPPNPGLVLYARVDGGFSVWDPARNYWRTKGNVDVQDRPAAYHFRAPGSFGPDERPMDIWNGLENEDSKVLCNGVLRDWAAWQKERGPAFDALKAVLVHLSCSASDPMVPGALTRISLDDVRDIPTVRMPYGQDVPVPYLSAGMRRIIALGYLLVWSWQEHQRASEILGQPASRQLIFLVDEVEAHLHPQWQRRVMSSLLSVFGALAGVDGVEVQLICTTHSPILLASVEPYFDPKIDSVWELDLVKQQVTLRRFPWRRRGDVNSWLSSTVFDLQEPRSLDAELAISSAMKFLASPNTPPRPDLDRIDADLRKTLSDVDPFWIRWSAFAEKVRGDQ